MMVATKWKENCLHCRTASNLAKNIQHLTIQALLLNKKKPQKDCMILISWQGLSSRCLLNWN
jgi:hypothetical protein